MREILCKEEHARFREAFKEFLVQEIIPFCDQWEKEGIIPRAAWKKMGTHGYLCPWIEKEYGGAGLGLEHSFTIKEEMAYVGVYGLMAEAHNEHFYRDAKALELLLEPCQIQRNMLADEIAVRIIPNHWKDNHQVIPPLVAATAKHAHGSCVMGVL
jgi:alkylation response protein AidB-like acyl-CoA dehydrogenase